MTGDARELAMVIGVVIAALVVLCLLIVVLLGSIGSAKAGQEVFRPVKKAQKSIRQSTSDQTFRAHQVQQGRICFVTGESRATCGCPDCSKGKRKKR